MIALIARRQDKLGSAVKLRRHANGEENNVKHTTLSLRRRHLMIAGFASLVTPGSLLAALPRGIADEAGSAVHGKMVVSGRLLRTDGTPLAGATLELLDAPVDGDVSITSDADGRFMFTALAPAGRPPHFECRVSHPQHGTLTRTLHTTFAQVRRDENTTFAQVQRDEAGTWRAAFALTLA